MKKILTTILLVVILLFVSYLLLPYRIKTICFGDVCPQNGGTYVLYKQVYTKEECTAKGGKPITGIGWVEVYAGCSPDNFLSRWVEKTKN
ncbi:MAG: hypothetical protein EXS59_02235 [Candidatus Taylorbacteria bacterium]|nr:hypothetical protein [Candidatus Taylorbacteria bacterium]